MAVMIARFATRAIPVTDPGFWECSLEEHTLRVEAGRTFRRDPRQTSKWATNSERISFRRGPEISFRS